MLSRPGELTRRHDPDRFLTALFAPAEARETLFILYAFNHELARACEAAREPVIALMRLQWWREVVDGAHRAHEVAAPLAAALDEGRLARETLLAMVDGREAETGEGETLEEWREYVLATAGGVALAAARALGAEGDALTTARVFGAAYGAAGILRYRTALAASGRAVLPPGDGDVRALLCSEGRRWLMQGLAAHGPGRVQGRALSAVLVATLARRDLRRGDEDEHPRGLADRLAVTAAYLRGRP